MLRDTIYTQLEDLSDQAMAYEENSTATILKALLGARKAGMEHILARHIQDFIRTVLLPATEQKIAEIKSSKN